MKLETKRLILRPIKMSDAKDVVKNINNLNVSKCLLVVPHPYTLKDAKWFVNHCKEKRKEKPIKNYEFSITLKTDNKVIGGAGITNIDYEQGTADLGYWLGESYWRQGIMTEAINKLIEIAFNKLKLRRLRIPAFKSNKASNELARKLGFKYERCLRKAMKAKSTGKIHDETLWGLLKSEWKNKTNN